MLSPSFSPARAPPGYVPYMPWQNVDIFHHVFECPGSSIILKYLESITFKLHQDHKVLCQAAFSASCSQALSASQMWVCICCASSGQGLLTHLQLHQVVVYHTFLSWENSVTGCLGTALIHCEWWLSSSAELVVALILPLQWCAEMSLSSDCLFIVALGKL